MNWSPTAWSALAFLTFAVLVSARFSWRHARRTRELQARNTGLESRLADLRLRGLKGTLRPHFLLNSLSLISSLLDEDVKKADEALANLGDMLRISLANADLSEVLLEDELVFVDRYLAIARARFGSRVKARIDVDRDCLRARVPELILQPLVENSVQHAVAKQPGAHRIAVSARRRGDRIRLEVFDDGRGAPGLDTGRLEEGVGLAATRRQLRLLYGEDHLFEMRRESTGGTTVLVDLPYRQEVSDVDPDLDRRRRIAGA